MLAYAVRFEIDEIFLFYPDTLTGNSTNSSEIAIQDELADGRPVNIKSFQLPVMNRDLFTQNNISDNVLTDIFDVVRTNLIEKLKMIVLQDFKI